MHRNRLWLTASAATLCGAMLITTQHDQPTTPKTTDPKATAPSGHSTKPAATRCVEAYVIDGDTISCTLNGQPRVRVRIIGINAPEIRHGQEPGECYGPQATTELTRLLAGQPVTLATDPNNNDQDRYGRLLRTVSTPKTPNVGLHLVRTGHAHAYDTTQPYASAQTRAARQRNGLWANCPQGGV